jgi:hypothetical protein
LASFFRSSEKGAASPQFVFTNVRSGDGVDAVVDFIEERGGLAARR